MGSDRARISYDQKQQYRSVVMQQGRVTLEADWNEAQMISSEETRREALDFVGPAGTPDNGYDITLLPPGFDFQIGPGTMYVGGVRAHLLAPEDYSNQSDWMDSANDGAWASVPQSTPTQNEYVYLVLREQEVSGIEDPDLKDVALGGPDTAQRTRLIQHVERLLTSGTDCASAFAAATAANGRWALDGFAFDPDDMRVRSFARMQVSMVSNGTGTSCDPTAQGGYLGADNQLIRVQISSVAPNQKPTFLWGYDDASFLYPVKVTSATTLKLQVAPVDAEHIPQGQQAVEVLMDAAQLSNGAYVAAPSGQVFTLAGSPYNADSQTLTLPPGLNASLYGDGTSNNPSPPQVYLRVWQQQLSFTPGVAVPLGSTGVQVTITSANNQPFRVGDYWMFAVRPETPQQVYPERYLTTQADAGTPQPPDGPREWICPLGVLLWSASPPSVYNCRNSFDNLVTLTNKEQGGCCTVDVQPADLTGNVTLQSVIDTYKNLQSPTEICLLPGTYSLPAPLRFTSAHTNIGLKGCRAGGVVIQAQSENESQFADGLIVLDNVSNVSLRGISFAMPLVKFSAPDGRFAGAPVDALYSDMQRVVNNMAVSIGVRPVNCTGLTVEDCTFDFTGFENLISNSNASPFAVGIFASGQSSGWQIRRTTFSGQGDVFAGILLVPQVAFASSAAPAPPTNFGGTIVNQSIVASEQALAEHAVTEQAVTEHAVTPDAVTGEAVTGEAVTGEVPIGEVVDTQFLAGNAALGLGGRILGFLNQGTSAAGLAGGGGTVLPSSLDRAVFESNIFSGLTLGVLLLGTAQSVQFTRNQVNGCNAGFWLLTALQAGSIPFDPNGTALFGLSIAIGYPLPQKDTTTAAQIVTVPAAPAAIRVYTGAIRKGALNAVTDSQGNQWLPDESKIASFSFSGGALAHYPAPVGGIVSATAADQPLYLSERYGNSFSYTFSNLPAGYYQVTLKFSELFYTDPPYNPNTGIRVFNVSINGQQVLTDLDIVKYAGAADTVYDTIFNNVVPNSGQVVIQFTGTAIGKDQNAKIGAAEVVPQWSGIVPNSILPSELAEFVQFYTQLVQLAQQGFVTPAASPMSLRIGDNEMQKLTSVGILVMGDDDKTLNQKISSVLMTGNRVAANLPLRRETYDKFGNQSIGFSSAAYVNSVTLCLVSSNMILNQAIGDFSHSFVLDDSAATSTAPNTQIVALPQVMVASNIFQGNTRISPERDPSSVPNSWNYLNTVFY